MTESEKTDTGYWLTFGNQTFPKGAKGNRLKFPRFPVIDGYGLGSQIMAIFPNIDTAEIAGKYSVSKSIEDDAPIVLLEVRDDGTTRRVPYWAELDIKAKDSPKEQILFVRPAEILKDNTRYVVGFRDLETTSGEEITASDSFAKLRDENIEAGSRLSQRKSRFEEVFDILQDAGIDRDNLTLAWDFRTASSQYLHGRLRKLVQRGLNEVSSKGPKVIVEGTEVLDKSRSEHIALRIRGRFEVPKYTKKLDSVGWRLVRDHKGRILQNGTKEVDFIANVPRSALEEGETQMILFGHGLLGTRLQINVSDATLLADKYNYTMVAADLSGMSVQDLGVASGLAKNFNRASALTDRLLQGIMEYVLLGRASTGRFGELKPLRSRNITIDQDQQFYVGASQGGIFGQTVVSLSPDIERGYLIVPGNNYATLLQRSTQFDEFRKTIKERHPSPADRAILISAIQLLWDRTDPVSYVRHLSEDPFYSEPNEVLLAVAKGDHQVAPVTNEHVARSDINIPIMTPYDATREPWGVNTADYPRDGSGIVLYDFGNPWPDDGNTPPKDPQPDPHNEITGVPEARQQANTFLQTGNITEVCDGPCQF
jgi:hypothetical protein